MLFQTVLSRHASIARIHTQNSNLEHCFSQIRSSVAESALSNDQLLSHGPSHSHYLPCVRSQCKQQLACVASRWCCVCMQDAHDGPLTSLFFFPGEPLLMSGAADNSLKQWLFDSADGTARLLRFRSGHSAPPSCLKFYGSGNKLLSAGQPLSPYALPACHPCLHAPAVMLLSASEACTILFRLTAATPDCKPCHKRSAGGFAIVMVLVELGFGHA